MFLPSLCPISEFQTDAVYEISALVCKAITFLKFETNKVMQIGIMQELILVRVTYIPQTMVFLLHRNGLQQDPYHTL